MPLALHVGDRALNLISREECEILAVGELIGTVVYTIRYDDGRLGLIGHYYTKFVGRKPCAASRGNQEAHSKR